MLVAEDKGGDWHFVGNGMYHCLDRKGTIVGRIASKHVPDPYAIWQNRCADKQIVPNSSEGKQLKPNDVVFKLWEHVNANTNK